VKSVKPLQRISVATTPEAEDAVAELLSTALGLTAVAYNDNETGLSKVAVYLQKKLGSPRNLRGEISAGLRRIKSCGLKIGPGRITITRVRREDWAESWKRHFKPIEIIGNRARHSVGTTTTARRGRRTLPKSLLIKPSWSQRKARKGQAVVVLDPGLSFGTGQHPTTAFCLGEIVRSADSPSAGCKPENSRTSRPRSLLDLGTGSGILAIAAAKLGYSPVRAMDFDPEAIRVARANARANRVQQKLKIRQGDVTRLPIRPRQQRQRYDLVCANLISDLLIAERRRIAAQLNRGGTLVLAGILGSEFAKVQKAFEALGLKLASSRSEKEWRSGSFCVAR